MKESVIRLMTRLAARHGAVNLSQGFPDEPPPFEAVWGAVAALLGGTDEAIHRLNDSSLRSVLQARGIDPEHFLDWPLKEGLALLQGRRDLYNQYSFPFGLAELREEVASYVERFAGFRPDPESEITIVAGATEGFSSALRATCPAGSSVILFQPFHEMYPSQAELFGLRPFYVTLREDPRGERWELDRDQLVASLDSSVSAVVLNTPHNPTGKVFSREELEFIGELCRKHELLLITDEIYEHITYDGHRHCCPASLEGMRECTIVVNSVSKTGSATGWRVGWVLSPRQYTGAIRSAHDTLVIQAPTPLQKAAIRLLRLPGDYYAEMRRAYQDKRDLLLQALRRAGFRCPAPQGAYYLFADYRKVEALKQLSPMEAALFLIERIGVACVPGDNFYRTVRDGDHYLRFAFCRSLDSLREASRRLDSLSSG